jgi:hypothetical protein
MEPFRLHIKIGEHEFDAQGEQEAVERQFATWRELISQLPSPPPGPAQHAVESPLPSPTGPGSVGDFVEYDKVFHQDQRVVSLTALPRGDHAEADAALLILLGRKHYLNEDLVGGAWVLDGLERSGIPVRVGRVDRLFGDYIDQLVLRSGKGRAVRYRLTNQGLVRAKEMARELAKAVA